MILDLLLRLLLRSPLPRQVQGQALLPPSLVEREPRRWVGGYVASLLGLWLFLPAVVYLVFLQGWSGARQPPLTASGP